MARPITASNGEPWTAPIARLDVLFSGERLTLLIDLKSIALDVDLNHEANCTNRKRYIATLRL